MSDILGHDIDGRPLRVGDEVVVVNPFHPEHLGLRLVVIGRAPQEEPWEIYVSLWNNFANDWTMAIGSQLSKLHKDHRPADEPFAEMMSSLKQVTA